MDAEGWIPIAILAGFNRIRTLTPDPALVRDVLALSALAEVRDAHARMSGGLWQQFVLPNAQPSAFGDAPVGSGLVGGAGKEEESKEEEGEEEEEVEFVVGPEAGRAWTPTAAASA